MITETQGIVAYLHQGQWFDTAQVQKSRVSDKGAYMDAHPYTIAALRRRREYGRDVPEWINLDEWRRG